MALDVLWPRQTRRKLVPELLENEVEICLAAVQQTEPVAGRLGNESFYRVFISGGDGQNRVRLQGTRA